MSRTVPSNLFSSEWTKGYLQYHHRTELPNIHYPRFRFRCSEDQVGFSLGKQTWVTSDEHNKENGSEGKEKKKTKNEAAQHSIRTHGNTEKGTKEINKWNMNHSR